MYTFSIVLIVVSNVFYHIFQKVTPARVNPLIALAVTYALATIVCLAFAPTFQPKAPLLASLRLVNWSSIGLAFAIVGLELGYILAYRSQWNISLGPLVANVAVAVLLLPVGLILFREKLSPLNALGVGVCLVGLMMVTSR